MSSRQQFALRLFVFATTPALVTWGLGNLYLPLLYLIAPVLLPLTSYTFDTALGRYTPLAFDRHGWHFVALYSLIIGVLAAVLSRRKRLSAAVGVFFSVVVIAAVLVHLTALVSGYTMWMDTP